MAEVKQVKDVKPQKNLMTPRGVAIFPFLNTPDTKFNPDGEYKVRLRITPEEAEALLAKLDAKYQETLEVARAQHKANPKTRAKKLTENELPIAEEFDYESGEPTGFYTVSLKASAKIKRANGDSVDRNVPFFDAKGTELKAKKPAVFGGAELKVAFDAVPYYTAGVGAGLTLRIAAVQVISVGGSGGSGGNYGFGSEDGGYEAEDESEDNPPFSNEESEDEGETAADEF